MIGSLRGSCVKWWFLFISAILVLVEGFSTSRSVWSIGHIHNRHLHPPSLYERNHNNDDDVRNFEDDSRRDVLKQLGLCVMGLISNQEAALASVGTLPEFADTNVVLQGLTVKVADKSQQDAMIAFLQDSFDFKVLRQRFMGSVMETWMGFGPEELSIPPNFVIPVSSLSEYGGHASIRIRFDEKATDVFYRQGEPAPGDNIAFLQLGVPTYRVSQMVNNGGNVLDAYGYVNVVSPCGLALRAIVGIRPDPMMFVALNCQDIKQSKMFYEQLGFVDQEYPYARLSMGASQFEPPQPKNSVYLAPSPNSMGILLLQYPKGKAPKPNPCLDSLQLIFSPSGEVANDNVATMTDPSGIGIAFQSQEKFEKEEKETR